MSLQGTDVIEVHGAQVALKRSCHGVRVHVNRQTRPPTVRLVANVAFVLPSLQLYLLIVPLTSTNVGDALTFFVLTLVTCTFIF